jgi:O-antigen ligase
MTQASLLFLGLMLTVPFLNPIHHYPITSFYEEWWALVFGLLAAVALLFSAPLRIALPSFLWLPGVLLATVLLQAVTGMTAGREFVLFHAGYLSWAALLAVLGATLSAQLGQPLFFRALATALLFGALLSATLAYAQWLHLQLPWQVLFPVPDGAVMANVAQANILTSYLWLGIASAILLAEQARLTRLQALICILLLGSAAGLTGSRMALLHGFGLLAAALLLFRREQPAIRIQRLLLLGLALITVVSVWRFFPGRGASAMGRLARPVISGDARLDLWRDTLTLIRDHPWLGNGIGNFPWRMVEAAARAPQGAATNPGAEHAHNILLQLAVDFGVPLALAALLFMLVWLVRAYRMSANRDALWGGSVFIILGIHSMLEYPLWYANYLGLFCLVAGAMDTRTRQVAYPARRPLLPMALTAGVVALIPLFLDYRALDHATNQRPAQYSLTDWRQRMDTVATVATSSAMGAYAYIALAVLMEPEQKLAAQQSYVCERGMRLWADPVIVTRCAILRDLNGDTRGAQELLALAQRAYRDPVRQSAILATLDLAAKKNPKAANLRVLAGKRNAD